MDSGNGFSTVNESQLSKNFLRVYIYIDKIILILLIKIIFMIG
jgi:hypothetical protein